METTTTAERITELAAALAQAKAEKAELAAALAQAKAEKAELAAVLASRVRIAIQADRRRD